MNTIQAGAAVVSPDQNEGGPKRPSSTPPTGPTPMDTDQTILNSALGTLGRPDSDSAGTSRAQQSAGPDQARGLPASDAPMTDVDHAAQRTGQLGVVTDDSTQNESVLTTTNPSGTDDSALTQQGSEHEEEVAQLGFAVHFVVQGLRNGAGPTLMPLLVRLLPFLLKTQVLLLRLHLQPPGPVALVIVCKNYRNRDEACCNSGNIQVGGAGETQASCVFLPDLALECSRQQQSAVFVQHGSAMVIVGA